MGMKSSDQSVCFMEDTTYVYSEDGFELLFYLEDVKSKGNIHFVPLSLEANSTMVRASHVALPI
jgi:hypothetical protein